MTDETEQKRLDTVHNEQTKLSATLLNGVAIATYAVGGFAPFVTVAAGGAATAGGVALMFVCPALAFGLHWAARRVLRRMR